MPDPPCLLMTRSHIQEMFMPSTEELVKAAKADDVSALAELVRRHEGTRDKMFKMAGIDIPPKPEQYRDPRSSAVLDATFGLARISVIQRENPDAAFHGIDVGPSMMTECFSAGSCRMVGTK